MAEKHFFLEQNNAVYPLIDYEGSLALFITLYKKLHSNSEGNHVHLFLLVTLLAK